MAAPTNIWNTNVAAVQVGGQNILASLLDPNLSGARIKIITATYTMTGNEVANDVVNIAKIPSGCLVDPTSSSIASTGIATTATAQLGDTDTQGGTVAYDPGRYSTAIDVHAKTTTVAVSASGGTTLNAPAEITDDWVMLICTFATLAVPVAGAQLIFRIEVAMLD